MKEITGDLFKIECDAICITTNGFVKKNGCLVMGRGVAKQATILYPTIDKRFGTFVTNNGNRVGIFKHYKTEKYICTFPVKHNWNEKADINLIIRSAKELIKCINHQELKWTKIVIPKPGCGSGKLLWQNVKKVIAPILDDRFYIIDLKQD